MHKKRCGHCNILRAEKVIFGETSRLIMYSAAKDQEDDDEPRIPPPPPTPLDFPRCRLAAKDPNATDPTLDLLKLFSNILRTGPSRKHLEALNVDFEDNVALSSLVPLAFLPPLDWTQDPAKAKADGVLDKKVPSKEILSNGGPAPGHEAFFTRARELTHDNEDAFRAVKQKGPRSGVGATRILHFRKFWDGLCLMSEYWDSSQDNYSKAQPNDTSADGNPSPSAMDIDTLAAQVKDPDGTNSASEDNSEETYTGRRKDTGRNMPPKYREETVFSFVEPLTWCFRCRLEHARMQPKVKVSGMILPLPHNGNIYRIPEDPRLARRSILEGPLAGVFCRDQLCFRRPDDAEGDGKQEILDLLREAGLGLMLAQKRAREGLKEEKPGEGQWWATKPRWGGGKGGEMGLSDEEAVVTVEDTTNAQSPPPGKRPRRMNRAAAWKEVRPPATTWERGVTYLRVGCGKGNDYDDIYLFSALNHHISIVHLRVHRLYIRHLACHRREGKPEDSKQPWCKLEARRTRWYDLFSVGDRVEAMRGIWAVMGFLMKREEDEEQGTGALVQDTKGKTA